MSESLIRWRMSLGLPLVAALALILSPGAMMAGSHANNSKHGGHGSSSSAWSDDFSESSLDTSFWVIASGQAPGAVNCAHIGYYDPQNVSLSNGYLILKLTQADGTVNGCQGVISDGALVYTANSYGYGTYEWVMRMSSTSDTPDGAGYPTSGSVSAGFLYARNSKTEIDFEFPGDSSDLLYMVNWQTTRHETFTTVSGLGVADNFHTYKLVWQPGEIDYYVDGYLESIHTTNIPTAPANFMINHWGTNSTAWGGLATVNTTRYFYIDSVSYTPLP